MKEQNKMKKLMIAAAIVCAAAMSQAALIKWGNASTSALYGLDGSTKLTSKTAGLTVQLMMVGAEEDRVFATASGIDSMTAGVLTGASSANYTYGSDAKKGDQFYILATLVQGGTTYEMVIDNAGSNWAITAQDNGGTDTFAWTAGTYGGLGKEGDTGKWVAQSVPEPTSGLLLLLGLGAMALRRRRA